MNEENLIPMNQRSKSEVRELGKKGGIASGKVRQEKKLLKELLEDALSKGTETDNEYINITLALIKEANKGNVKAYEVIRDTLGQKPVDKVELTNNIDESIAEMDAYLCKKKN